MPDLRDPDGCVSDRRQRARDVDGQRETQRGARPVPSAVPDPSDQPGSEERAGDIACEGIHERRRPDRRVRAAGRSGISSGSYRAQCLGQFSTGKKAESEDRRNAFRPHPGTEHDPGGKRHGEAARTQADAVCVARRMDRGRKRTRFRGSAVAAGQSFCQPGGAHAGARSAGKCRERGLDANPGGPFRRSSMGTFRADAGRMGRPPRPEMQILFPAESRLGRPAEGGHADPDAVRGDALRRQDEPVVLLRGGDPRRSRPGRTRPCAGFVRSEGTVRRSG